MAYQGVERQPSGYCAAGGEIFICAGAAWFWHVAGALRIPFLQRAVYFHSRDAKCFRESGLADFGCATVAVDGDPVAIYSADGDWFFVAGAGGIAAGGVSAGGRR